MPTGGGVRVEFMSSNFRIAIEKAVCIRFDPLRKFNVHHLKLGFISKHLTQGSFFYFFLELVGEVYLYFHNCIY